MAWGFVYLKELRAIDMAKLTVLSRNNTPDLEFQNFDQTRLMP